MEHEQMTNEFQGSSTAKSANFTNHHGVQGENYFKYAEPMGIEHDRTRKNTWRFPKIGVPHNHPLQWDFP